MQMYVFLFWWYKNNYHKLNMHIMDTHVRQPCSHTSGFYLHLSAYNSIYGTSTKADDLFIQASLSARVEMND